MVCILYFTSELHDFERVPFFRDKIIIIYCYFRTEFIRVSLIFMYFSLFISHFSLLYLCRYLICLLCLIIF